MGGNELQEEDVKNVTNVPDVGIEMWNMNVGNVFTTFPTFNTFITFLFNGQRPLNKFSLSHFAFFSSSAWWRKRSASSGSLALITLNLFS